MRSDSASASPQVGRAGQAIAAACNTLRLVFGLHAVRGEQCVDAGFVRIRSTLARITF